MSYPALLNLTIGIACLLGQSAAAADGFFDDTGVLEIVVEAPLSKLNRQRGPDPDWMTGKVHCDDARGNQRIYDIEIRARGNYRREKDNCSFPPYMLNFKKSQVKDTVLDGLDKVKVVSHCRPRPESFKDYIFKEYLAYKTYNLLTESSFRVRLVSVRYADPGKDPVGEAKVAFMIESVDSLAERLGGSENPAPFALPSAFIPEAVCLAHMFQYFLGNIDFSFVNGEEDCCHNAKVIQTSDGLIPVPYDFDITGLVNVPYAVVNPRLPIKSLEDRYYRGFKTSEGVLQQTVEQFISQKDAIIDLWLTDENLSGPEKEVALKFIREFYEVIEDPVLLEKEIISRMRSTEKLEAALLRKYGGQLIEQ